MQLDLVSEYWLGVFEPFLGRLESGYTPNPDLPCNVHIKFGPMLEYAKRRLGADMLATGHYARLVRRSTINLESRQQSGDTETVQLARAVDDTKDQSYFLATVRSQSDFSSVIVGTMRSLNAALSVLHHVLRGQIVAKCRFEHFVKSS